MRRKHAAAEPSRVGYAACATWAIEDDNHDHGYTRLGEHSSGNSVKVTLDRLEAMLKAKGNTVFARIDHAAGAAAVGMPVRPSGLLIFGDPTAGTGPMQPEQTIGIDLPLKVLVWEDASGGVWISYDAPAWLAVRQGSTTARRTLSTPRSGSLRNSPRWRQAPDPATGPSHLVVQAGEARRNEPRHD